MIVIVTVLTYPVLTPLYNPISGHGWSDLARCLEAGHISVNTVKTTRDIVRRATQGQVRTVWSCTTKHWEVEDYDRGNIIIKKSEGEEGLQSFIPKLQIGSSKFYS